MLESLATSVVSMYLPTEYLPLALLAVTVLLAVSEYLSTTDRFKANGNIQAVANIARLLLGKLSQKNTPPAPPQSGDIPGSPRKPSD